MSHIHQSCNCRVLRTPPRAPARWRTILNGIVLVLEAFREAQEMARAAYQKYPFDNE
jgi:hypothetical protein